MLVPALLQYSNTNNSAFDEQEKNFLLHELEKSRAEGVAWRNCKDNAVRTRCPMLLLFWKCQGFLYLKCENDAGSHPWGL